MYIPKHFEITDINEIVSFIQANGFGQLISTLDGKPFVSHIPFLLSSDQTALLGHIANANPQHSDVQNQEVLVTLQGPHDYISPSWYNSPGVPTWNYQAVHIFGKCKTFTDPEKLKSIVDSLTAKYEANLSEPWLPDYRPNMLSGIVGLEISIEEIQCKYKLNQNRSLDDQQRVIKQLENFGSRGLADAMKMQASKNT